jgi:hypothetical protein
MIDQAITVVVYAIGARTGLPLTAHRFTPSGRDFSIAIPPRATVHERRDGSRSVRPERGAGGFTQPANFEVTNAPPRSEQDRKSDELPERDRHRLSGRFPTPTLGR